MQFRKKPVVVEAVQWFPDAGIYHRGVYCDLEGADAGRPYVITIHNERAHLAPGDWILPEPDGFSFYPCKPDVFAKTYEPVDTPAAALARHPALEEDPQKGSGVSGDIGPCGPQFVTVQPKEEKNRVD